MLDIEYTVLVKSLNCQKSKISILKNFEAPKLPQYCFQQFQRIKKSILDNFWNTKTSKMPKVLFKFLSFHPKSRIISRFQMMYYVLQFDVINPNLDGSPSFASLLSLSKGIVISSKKSCMCPTNMYKKTLLLNESLAKCQLCYSRYHHC